MIRASHDGSGVLPDPTAGARQPADMEAVEADQLAWAVDFDVPSDQWRLPFRPRWCGIAGNQAEARDAAGQAVPSQHPPDAVGTDRDGSPALLGQCCADPSWTESGMGDGGRSISRPERSTIAFQR
jgi:hypothetical protein